MPDTRIKLTSSTAWLIFDLHIRPEATWHLWHLTRPLPRSHPPSRYSQSSSRTGLCALRFVDILNRSKYTDFRAELKENGFAVLKGVIPHDRAVQYQIKAYEWLKSFPGDLHLSDPTTLVASNLPLTNKVRLYHSYCVAHEKSMCDARMEPGLLDAFSKLWVTKELLVSFDCLNISLPRRSDQVRRAPWKHIDQSPSMRGVHCVQGIIDLSPSAPEDGGLVVFPGSHKLHDEFFDTHPRPPSSRNVYLFTPDELTWFKQRGLSAHKICVEVGDLILWDSRVIHYGSEPTKKSNQIRTVIYPTYQPAKLASPEQSKNKKAVFEAFGSTTHRPYEHIVPGPTPALLQAGTRDPGDQDEPSEKPELARKLLKLADVMSY